MQAVTQDVFRRIPSEQVHGSSILRVASQFVYVGIDDNIETIADGFSRHVEVLAVGVVDEDDLLIGVIERGELFHRLGRPFGRDILSRKTAGEVVERVESFYYESNVFSVAELVGRSAGDRERIRYFGLINDRGGFVGLFSSIDILVYLSAITQEDIDMAGVLQERMLQQGTFQESHWCRFMGFSQFAKGMGGDFSYTAALGNGRYFFTLCDVSGKGAAASIITSMLWGMLRVYDWSKGIVQLITEINQAVIQSFHLEKYLTGIFAHYNEQTHELLIADMGHSHVYVLRGERVLHIESERKNLPVGIQLNLEPSLLRVRLKPGDMLAVATDGLLEQENEDGVCREIEQWLQPAIGTPGEEICGVLQQNFNDFRGGVVQLDDVSVLLMQVLS
ncbi:MAG: PP2C family protein-serine/threonine phosphatase [Spirochaeta sp.]